MNKINPNFLFPLMALILLISGLSISIGEIPPLGKILDPFIGVVQNGSDSELEISEMIIDDTGLEKSVTVFFDERKVPHIYAENDNDLYFSQGYVAASMRLWQMDFLSYVSAGRLSEIFDDPTYLNYDRSQRRIGILESARKSLELIKKNPKTFCALRNYTKGVNAFISSLDYANYPVEYKLLNYQPETWSILKSVLLLKHMGNTLSGYEEDLNMSNLMVALGEDDFNKLFPDSHSHTTPLMNNLIGEINPSLAHIVKPQYLNYSFLSSKTSVKSNYNPKLGSNSWAVSGKKTKSGYPILCNDPHLNLSLPSIWLEMQLSCPGMNVYGVSIPGTPSIIIGFNENVAWGITNGADDVKDWYKLKIRENYSRYKLDGKWLDLNYRIEKIKQKGGKTFYDTIYNSVHGPIVFDKSFPNINDELVNHALRWELHQPSNEFLTFIELNQAKNYKDYKNAIKHYKCPMQNFTFACKDNTISINHQGNMPIRSATQGEFILDGTTSSHLYSAYIPLDSLPQSKNPESNFILSANQHPTTNNYPYYYYGYFFESRANQIQKMLITEDDFDAQKMKKIQLDNTNEFAAVALPVLTKNLMKNKLATVEKEFLKKIKKWNHQYNKDEEYALFFELWWYKIETNTWDEITNYSFNSTIPENYVLVDLIQKEPSNSYFDRQGTTEKENASRIIYDSFKHAIEDYKYFKKHSSVKWGKNNRLKIMHLTNKEVFSKIGIPSSGHPTAINACTESWGPSWRMVVELGDRPKGYGIYAGGQSGNVGSKHYDNFIQDWNKGKYYSLIFFMTKDEAEKGTKNKWILN